MVVLALLDQVKIGLRVDNKELIVAMVLLMVVIELQAEYLPVKPRENSLRGSLPFFIMLLLSFVVGNVDFLEDGQFNQGCCLGALVFLDVVKEVLFRSFIAFNELLLAQDEFLLVSEATIFLTIYKILGHSELRGE